MLPQFPAETPQGLFDDFDGAAGGLDLDLGGGGELLRLDLEGKGILLTQCCIRAS